MVDRLPSEVFVVHYAEDRPPSPSPAATTSPLQSRRRAGSLTGGRKGLEREGSFEKKAPSRESSYENKYSTSAPVSNLLAPINPAPVSPDRDSPDTILKSSGLAALTSGSDHSRGSHRGDDRLFNLLPGPVDPRRDRRQQMRLLRHAFRFQPLFFNRPYLQVGFVANSNS